MSRATPVSWSNASGTTTNFSWSNGQNDNGLAGDPTQSNNLFSFFPSGLKATASNGSSDMVDETIHVTLTPIAGMRITGIQATFSGDEDAFGGIAPASNIQPALVLPTSSAGYSASLDAVKTTGGSHVTSSIAPPDTTTQNAFSDNLSLTIPQSLSNAINFTLHVEVHAATNGFANTDTTDAIHPLGISLPGSSAFSEMKVIQFKVETAPSQNQVVPLPAAVLTAPFGAAVAAWASRRMKKKA
jgi:hypothetical protein